MPIRRLDKTLTATTATVAGEDIAASAIPVKPHIQYGVLQPAIAGKLLDGTTSHSGAYGTAQSDGHSYYYTDIKGSKAIKDPRIGAHFGSQRHKFKSLQILEQETATNGKDIFSIDGREWIRAYSTGGKWNPINDSGGSYIRADDDATGCFLEITGYFNDINFMVYCWNNRVDDIDISVNGTLSVDGSTTLGGDTTVETPLGSRFVDASSVINGGSTLSASLGTTPKINTIKYEIKSGSGEYLAIMGIELIAQDTTSTANKSKIQIPAQNVVSYGKKFALSAAAHHYDPFNGFTNGTDISGYIDEATSLGMSKWKISSTWYRPFNGGRVVKWIDSSGAIKTSVTMMPPNARSVANSASPTNAFATRTTASHFATNNPMNSFEAGTDLDVDRLSEVAKTFNIREFGNGAANGGAGATNYSDVSMLFGGDNISYVMDDGLTTFGGKGILANQGGNDYRPAVDGLDSFYITFIGTGISCRRKDSSGGSDTKADSIDGVAIRSGAQTATTASRAWGTETLAQNLPYGTHVWQHGPNTGANFWRAYDEVTFHQPKMPPIPEDACIISDYMLMADYVANATAGLSRISKGVRRVGATRDVLYDQASGTWGTMNYTLGNAFHSPFTESSTSAIAKSFKLPFFGNGLERPFTGHSNKTATITPQFSVAGAAFANANAVSPSLTITSSTSAYNSGTNVLNQTVGSNDSAQFVSYGNNLTLGVNEYKESSSASGYLNVSCLDIVSPVHSSSHYQSFETPYLKELVGGDRNMEQTNLVVTSDGKSWDEVTRDTSYIGNIVFSGSKDSSQNTLGIYILDDWRGTGGNASAAYFNKDFAIAYDRWICLKDGWYQIFHQFHTNNSINTSDYCRILVNGVRVGQVYQADQSYVAMGMNVFASAYIERGDYVQIYGGSPGGDEESYIFQIIRL